MRHSLGVISRHEASILHPNFVKFSDGEFGAFSKFMDSIMDLKKGQLVIVRHVKNPLMFSIAKITKVDHRADDPSYRVSDGLISWNVGQSLAPV